MSLARVRALAALSPRPRRARASAPPQDWNEWITISSGRVFLVDPDSAHGGPSAAFSGAPTLPCEGCGRLLEKRALGARRRAPPRARAAARPRRRRRPLAI
jgi:hypothetical protein